ncbi:unnamed protein product [Schistocephalus solidus]|uniref:Uncharacterized protein n=1 Tax=Schistocephalus solidus TaxID=70667 RepID=A0A183THX3_SCHSO|nr:unnamed protein product [Schistocephalus solidus]
MTSSNEAKENVTEPARPLCVCAEGGQSGRPWQTSCPRLDRQHYPAGSAEPHGLGGLLLLRTCAGNRLLLINICFRLPTWEKGTSMQPQSRRWQLLDNVLVRRRDK